MIKIGYQTEGIPERWSKLIDSAQNREELIVVCEDFGDLAEDALDVVAKMREEDFLGFRKGLKSERKGRFPGHEWADRYGSVLLPGVMLKISVFAETYEVPFGTAYLLWKEIGRGP